MRVDRPNYAGRTVVCIASGPSLTEEDCEIVRSSGHPVIVTNATFRMCPWADVLFCFDAKFWERHSREIDAVFTGLKVSMSTAAKGLGVASTYQATWFKGQGNSGVCAIAFALAGNAKKIVMLGYDCQKTGGKSHWHGDHPLGLSNCASIKHWPRQFAQIAAQARAQQIPVINASRQTALSCFDRGDLLEALR